MSNLNVNDLTTKLQQLQAQVAQFNQIQSQQPQPAQQGTSSVAAPTTYPRTIRTDTVEDILNNPQWRQELEAEFNTSEFGKRAKNHVDMIFMEFCENQTGKPSVMLNDLRKETRGNDKKPAKKPVESTKPEEPIKS